MKNYITYEFEEYKDIFKGQILRTNSSHKLIIVLITELIIELIIV